jgi:O-antigen ligase
MVVRVVDVVLGLWLVASAFLWPHGTAQFLNAAVTGALIAAISAVALLARDRARHVTTGLAVWLFLANLLLPGTTLATAWNHAVLAVILFLLSMVPSHRDGRRVRTAAT